MRAQTMKRTFLRTHRYGMNMQREMKRRFGAERNVRSPQGRELLASNHVYRVMHSEWGTR